MLKIVNKWSKIIQKWLGHCLCLPSHCLLCLTDTKSEIICVDCEGNLPWLRTPHLAPPLLQNHPMHALFEYRSPLTGFIVKLKFHQALHFADWFAHMMIKTWECPRVDCIVPLPLHPLRQQERGFNQTLEIAKILAAHLKLPLDRWSCTRIKHRTPQSQLSAQKRRANLDASSFHVSPDLKDKRILVIEDVITTGATLHAFIQALQQAGAKEVIVWACCQTLKH